LSTILLKRALFRKQPWPPSPPTSEKNKKDEVKVREPVRAALKSAVRNEYVSSKLILKNFNENQIVELT
jgi:hypothetical protein